MQTDLWSELDQEQFIQACHLVFLGREPETGLESWFNDQLNLLGRRALAHKFMQSDEFRMKAFSDPYVRQVLYESCLQHSHISPELDGKIGVLVRIPAIPVFVPGGPFRVHDLPPFSATRWIQEELCNDGYKIIDLELDPSAVIVDVGAHVGLFSMSVSRRWPNGRIFAAEPMPVNFENMKVNLELNNVHNVKLHNLAIASGSLSLRLYHDVTVNTGGATVLWSSLSSSLPHIDVPAISLLSFFERCRIEECDLMKVDCEGSEYFIFGDDFPYHRVGHLRIELHRSKDFEARGHSPEKLLAILQDKLSPERVYATIVNKDNELPR